VELVERRDFVKSSLMQLLAHNFLHTTFCSSRRNSMMEELSCRRKCPDTNFDQGDKRVRNLMTDQDTEKRSASPHHMAPKKDTGG